MLIVLPTLTIVMSQLAMQALAVGGQSSLRVGVLPPGRFVPLALFPAQASLAVLLDTPLLVVVLWIIGAALPLHLALQASFFPGIGCQFLTERDQIGFALAWHNRQRLGAKEAPGTIRYSASLGTNAEKLLDQARQFGLEGLIGKRVGSHYETGRRSGSWIKLKLQQEQEFIIGGYTEPAGSRHHFGALLVGVYEKDQLKFAGKVGTGFNEKSLRTLLELFNKVPRSTCPFVDLPEKRAGRYGQGVTASEMKHCHWIQPEIVCQIKFREWTRDQRLRQPVFLGIREDKDAKEVVREEPS